MKRILRLTSNFSRNSTKKSSKGKELKWKSFKRNKELKEIKSAQDEPGRTRSF
jgi:hypothetical protein